MTQTPRVRLQQLARLSAAPALAGLLLAGPSALLASPPPATLAPSAYLQDEDAPAVLSDDEINLIQVYELDLDDEPRVRIGRDVLEKFLEDPAYADRDGMPRGRDEVRAFMRAEGHQQLGLFFEMRAREYYGEARVQDAPPALRNFERLNTRYITQYFARHFANRDLGEDVAIAFRGQPIEQIPLLGRGRDSKAIAYTNFYILSQLTINGIPVIDRDNPEESLLVQWGMPRVDARFDAPDVDGWQPQFRGGGEEDARLDEVLDWISSLHKFNQGSTYGVEYLPPALRND